MLQAGYGIPYPAACCASASRCHRSRLLTWPNQFGYGHLMIRYRIFFAHILLVISLVLTSGAIATAAALLQGGAPTACCKADTGSSTIPLDVPCSEPDCQCISCLVCVVTVCSRQPAYNGFHAASSFSRIVKAPPLEYIKTIDYPPEFS